MSTTTAETYLRDELAESLARHAERLPEARELLGHLAGATRVSGTRRAPRVAVRGLTGSARGYLASWLQRATGRTVLLVAPGGEAFDEIRDDIEYFRGPGGTMALPEPDTLPYDPSSPHPGITAQRLETLARLARGDRGVLLTTVRG